MTWPRASRYSQMLAARSWLSSISSKCIGRIPQAPAVQASVTAQRDGPGDGDRGQVVRRHVHAAPPLGGGERQPQRQRDAEAGPAQAGAALASQEEIGRATCRE